MPQVSKLSGASRPLANRVAQRGAPLAAAKSAWDLASSVRMLLYGASGTGKTTFAATAPGPILWLICSGGDKPGELKSIDTPEYRKKIHPVIISESRQLTMKGGLEEYATVVLDHASGMADLILREILGLAELPAQKGWGLASQQQYGQLALQCKEYLRGLLNLPCNVILIAQERVFGEEAASEIIRPTVGAALTPSVTGWLNPACDYVLQTYKRHRTEQVKRTVGGKEVVTSQRVKGVDYCLRTEPHDVYMTKFRVPRGLYLPERIVDPTWASFESVLNGTYGEGATSE